MNEKKKVAITVYIEADFSDILTRRYAAAVLKGYNGTKQTFLNDCIKNGLTIFDSVENYNAVTCSINGAMIVNEDGK